MKITALLLLIFCLQVNARTFSQRISLSEQNVPLEIVFKKISKQSGYQFIYNDELLQLANPVTINIKDVPLEEALELCLQGQPLTYSLIEKTIVIKPNKATPKKASSAIDIKGKVVDEKGEALPGVSVLVKGTAIGAATDIDGRFSLSVPNNSILVFSYIGYMSREVEIGNQTELTVTLSPDITKLSEVVVTALGLEKDAKSVTYAIQNISGKDINTVKDANFMNSLAGKAAGLVITKGSGGPGSSSRILMRGNKSIVGNNQPLYVIDGVPMNNTGAGSYGAIDRGDVISNINAEDIESVEVLSGASAAALYGSQAANGVILLTTKRGKSGVARIDFSSTALFENPVSLPELQTTYGQTNPGVNDSWGEKITNGSNKHLKEYFQTGTNYINHISISNGNDLAQFYLSYANTKATGIVPENDMNRHNITLRTTTQLFNDKLLLDGSVNYINQKVYNRQAPVNSPMFSLYTFPVGDDFSKYSGNNFEVWDPVRTMYVQNWPYVRNETRPNQNPYWIQKRNQNDIFRNRTISSLKAKYKIFKWLDLQGRITYDKIEDSYEQRMYASTQSTIAGVNGGYTTERSNINQLYADVLLTGNKNLNQDTYISATLGISNVSNQTSGISLSSTIPTSLSFPNYFSIFALNGPFNKSESLRKELTQAAFGSATVGFKETIFLDVTARNEWSSTVAQPFFYPSVGVSYILTETIGSSNIFSFAKLRGSYAEVGNRLPFGITNWAPPYSLDPLGNINARGSLPFFSGNDTINLKPERTKSYEFGTELRFLSNKLSLNVTYYNATTYDQVFQIQAPAGSGAQNFWINGGTIRNKGVEALLSYKASLGDFTWQPIITFSRNVNQIRELSNLLVADRFVLSSFNETRVAQLFLTRPANGKYGSYGDLYGRVYQRDESGNLLTNDKGLPLVSPNPDQYIGNAQPNFLLGFNNTFTFKNATLSLLIDGRFGGGVVSASEQWLDYKGLSKRSGEARDNGGVMVNGTLVDAKEYFYNKSGTVGIGAASEYFFDATNIRLRELAVGYSLPKIWKVNLNLSLVGRNLFFFYKNAPFDPELTLNASNQSQGIEGWTLPATRSYGLTLRASL